MSSKQLLLKGKCDMRLFMATCSILLLSMAESVAQPSIEWQRCLGGPGGEWAYAAQQTIDGGFVLAGNAGSNGGDVSGNNGSNDVWVVKLDPSGGLQWQRCLGGSNVEWANSIQQTTEGGYIVAGTSWSNNGDLNLNKGLSDYWIIRMNDAGTIQWQKSYGGSGYDEATSIRQTTDGGFIVAGHTTSNDGDIMLNQGGKDCWILKLDVLGSIQWQRSLGGSEDDLAHCIRQTTDGGYIFTGQTASNDGHVSGNHGNDDLWVVKLDGSGNIQWQRCYGGFAEEIGRSIEPAPDGGYVVAGSANFNDGDVSGNHGMDDFWVLRLDASGNILWQRCLGGNGTDRARSIHITTDGGSVIAGDSNSSNGQVTNNQGGWDYWLVKLDPTGMLQWQRTLGGSEYDVPHAVQQTAEGGYFIAGLTYSNNGHVSGNHGPPDMWAVKLGSDPNGILERSWQPLQIAPNPASTEIWLNVPAALLGQDVVLIDGSGREVLRKRTSNASFAVDVAGIARGVYLVHIEHATEVHGMARLVLE